MLSDKTVAVRRGPTRIASHRVESVTPFTIKRQRVRDVAVPADLSKSFDRLSNPDTWIDVVIVGVALGTSFTYSRTIVRNDTVESTISRPVW